MKSLMIPLTDDELIYLRADTIVNAFVRKEMRYQDKSYYWQTVVTYRTTRTSTSQINLPRRSSEDLAQEDLHQLVVKVNSAYTTHLRHKK